MKALRTGLFALALGTAALTADRAASANPFASFAGSWSGSGTISMQNGDRERIRCRGTYASRSDSELALVLRCASDSYRFELQSNINSSGSSLSGSWNETTRQIAGSLSGRVSGSRIDAVANSVGFNASISMSTRGNNQQVSIRSPGSEISEVAISLAKAR